MNKNDEQIIPVRGIIIRQPWVNHILNGEKTWELRGKNTKIRGPVALIEGGTGTIVGMFNITDSQGPLTREQRVEAAENKQILPCEIDEDMYENVYAWKVDNVIRFPQPVRYTHPSGAVIWVTLQEDVKNNIQAHMQKKLLIEQTLDIKNTSKPLI